MQTNRENQENVSKTGGFSETDSQGGLQGTMK